MTIIQDRPAVTTRTCPAWCAGLPDTHPDEEGEVGHQRPVGALGVAVEWWPTADEFSPDPEVYVPELDVDAMHASSAFARQLAVDLIAAADVIDGVTG